MLLTLITITKVAFVFQLSFFVSRMRKVWNWFSGSIVLTCGNFKQIYENAKKLMVDSLIEECERFLNQPINASNCLDLMICAHEMKRVKVEEKAVEYFTVSNCLERKKKGSCFQSDIFLTDTFL